MEKVKKDGEIVRETAKAAVVHGGRKVLLIAAGAVVPVRQREDNLTDVSAVERPDFSGGSRGSLKAFAQELINLTTKEVRALAEILKEEYGIVPAEPLIIEEVSASGGRETAANRAGAPPKAEPLCSEKAGKGQQPPEEKMILNQRP